MKEPVIEVRKNYILANKYKEKYEKDLVIKKPTVNIKNRGGVNVTTKEIDKLKNDLEKQHTELQEKIDKEITDTLDNLEKNIKTDEEIKEFEKIKDILNKKDVQE